MATEDAAAETGPGAAQAVEKAKVSAKSNDDDGEEEEEEEEAGMDFFNPDMFTAHVELERDSFEFGDVKTQLEFVHDSNQLVEKFVSRVVWPSAQEMCSHFAAHPDLVRGKRVIELGSGTGLCGITLALLGAEHVALTDNNAEAVELLARNVELNGASASCSSHTLAWGDAGDAAAIMAATGGARFDLVIGTDVVYEPGCIEPLFQSSLHLLDPAHGQFILANHTHRYGGLEARVKACAAQLGLSEAVMPSIVGEDGQIDWSIFTLPPVAAEPADTSAAAASSAQDE